MKIWITAPDWLLGDTVRLSLDNPKECLKEHNDASVYICRKHMRRLLRGTGKRLPRPGSNKVLELELLVVEEPKRKAKAKGE